MIDQKKLKSLSQELLGVIVDVEEGKGFDETCLNTIKRVHNILAGAELMSDKGYGVGSLDDPDFLEIQAKHQALYRK
jgi:hypothetical protein